MSSPVASSKENQIGRVKELLSELGENPERQGLIDTPQRFLRSMEFLTAGYHQDSGAIVKKALFDEAYEDMVIVRDIEFYSLCEHHLLPFYGKCHIGYVPDGRVIGLSKIPRVVDVFARRLQVQERLTHQICEDLQSHVAPKGVGVVIEASHLCMMMRGVQKQGSTTITSSMQGCFRNSATREEFLSLVQRASMS